MKLRDENEDAGVWPWRDVRRTEEGRAGTDVRLSRLHALLRSEQGREALSDEAENFGEEVPSEVGGLHRLAEKSPDAAATIDLEADVRQVAWALRVLRHHG